MDEPRDAIDAHTARRRDNGDESSVCGFVERKIADKFARLPVHRESILLALIGGVKQPHGVKRILCGAVAEADGAIALTYGIIACDGVPEQLFDAALDALVDSADALLGGHIVFIGEISSEICRLKIHRFGKIIRLDRLHEIVCHLLRAVNRDSRKVGIAASVGFIILRLGIVIVAVAPCSDRLGVICDRRVGMGIEEPERDIYALYFVDMILVFKCLGSRRLPLICFLTPPLRHSCRV